jgi:GNAT superfamily N-acetyltransferase
MTESSSPVPPESIAVPIEVRPYQNTDTACLCRVFRAHQQAAGWLVEVTPLSLEICVLAKPYFDAQLLVVAVLEGRVSGFAHLAYAPTEDLLGLDSGRGVISALYVEPGPEEQMLARALLTQIQELADGIGMQRLSYCPAPPASPYYVGLGPGDGMIGVPHGDVRLTGWLREAGFVPGLTLTAWESDLDTFQPPVDRMQIQIRRTAHVDRLLDEPWLPWYQACVLGHTEQVGFQLTSRAARRVTTEILLWSIGHDIVPDTQSTAHLWPMQKGSATPDELVFLLAEATRQLRDERVSRLLTISGTGDTIATATLTRVGFEPILHGTVFER